MQRLRREGLEFLTTAPTRLSFTAEVSAPQAAVFAAISADPSTWTWFPGLDEGRYEGDRPHGVGSIRTVRMGDDVYRETILAWDEPTRWAYRVDETTVDLFDALAEDWVVEARGDRAVVHWTFAIDPRPAIRDGLSDAQSLLGGVYRTAMANLSDRLATAGERPTARR